MRAGGGTPTSPHACGGVDPLRKNFWRGVGGTTPLNGIRELYFEKKFRIYFTIDTINHIVNIEGTYHRDEG
jgi:hypothetical protein